LEEEGGRLMDILQIFENDDGSATLEVSLTDEETQFLLQLAINTILREAVERHKDGDL
jgi:hypothetical protein